ncbi:MAG: hypothetical protein GPJ54_13305 [Candidatus Heimdallarchaeota archaeon]|nr:hypothetical protein [Candidatus Heimdallarchaeota archaeon]
MSFSRDNLKVYFFPVYYVWAFISPSLILLINPIPLRVIPAFYGLFGLIWPLTFVVYPAFLISINKEGTTLAGVPFLTIPLFFVAWLGPIAHLVFATFKHKKFISLKKQGDEKLSWPDYLSGFI